ncbi:MAG: AAA family ATPase [Prevotella sp.]|nr:AAA family ATPase [Prevotella sp.]
MIEILRKTGSTSKMEPNMSDFTFSKINITVGTTDMKTSSTPPYVFQQDNLSIVIDIDNISCKSEPDGQSFRIELLRRGNADPLYQTEYSPSFDGDYFLHTIDDIADKLIPGIYRLRLSNITPDTPDVRLLSDTCSCSYSFTLLANGESLVHPAITNATATIANGRELVLSMDSRWSVGQKDVFDVYCHNSSLMLVAQGSCMPRKRTAGRNLRVVVTAAHPLADGAYACLVTHNGEPFARVDLTVHGGRDVRVTGLGSISPGSHDHVMAGRLIQDAHDSKLWKRLRDTVGCGLLKRHALDYCRMAIHNEIRRLHEIAAIWRCDHHFIIGEPDAATKTAIERFANIAMPGKFFKSVDASRLSQSSNIADPMEEVRDRMSDTGNVLCIYGIGSLLWAAGRQVGAYIEECMVSGDAPTIFFLGNRSEIEQLKEQYPVMAGKVPAENMVEIEPLTADEIMYGIQQELESRELTLSEEAAETIESGLRKRAEAGLLGNKTSDYCARFVEESLMEGFRNRMITSCFTANGDIHHALTTIEACDINWTPMGCGNSNIADSLEDINGMVGLKSVKTTIRNIAMKAMFDNRCTEVGGKRTANCHHLIFTGNPGTGKTTVAKKLGKVFHALGILSKGNVVVAERSTIVGRYIGQTEQNMQRLLEQARGNVLFIDEAYTLVDTSDDRKDYGYRAIECLLTVLSNKNPDMVVIMAGYAKDMDRMLDANPGLRGRFPHHLHFDDYSVEELMEIGVNYLSANGLAITPDAAAAMRQFVEEQTANKGRDFSNARWMEQLVDADIIPAISERIFSATYDSEAAIWEVTDADIKAVAAKYAQKEPKRKIGF